MKSTASAARRRWRRWPMAPTTIAPVAKIVGPGNAYVAAAKRRVFGQVGIDMIAGPSEVLILADKTANPGLDRRRPAGPGRARHRRAIASSSPTTPRWPMRSRRPSSPACKPCRVKQSRKRAGAISARSSCVEDVWQRRCRSPTASPPSIWKSWPPTPRASPRACAMPARFSSAPIRRRRSAIMSAAPTMCCRRRARRGFRPASMCSIS